MEFDPRKVTENIVGAVEWEEPAAGLCKCPGESLHTHTTRRRDCLVRIDGAPTIYCFHTSCSGAVAEANLRLRRELGSSWELRLPSGGVLRSGQVAREGGGLAAGRARRRGACAKARLAEVECRARESLEEVLEEYEWPYAAIVESSPLAVEHRDPNEQYRLWLKLWPPHATIWIGDVTDSGSEASKSHFRSIADWYQLGPVMGNFTCGAMFRPGSTSRSNASVECRQFLVVESDELHRDEVGAVFRLMHKRLGFPLHCIVDTGGKSLHGWFSAPADAGMLARLRAGLTGLGCDPRMFNPSQPARLPGALRDGKVQKLIWLRT
jgi:hypothetical protein